VAYVDQIYVNFKKNKFLRFYESYNNKIIGIILGSVVIC